MSSIFTRILCASFLFLTIGAPAQNPQAATATAPERTEKPKISPQQAEELFSLLRRDFRLFRALRSSGGGCLGILGRSTNRQEQKTCTKNPGEDTAHPATCFAIQSGQSLVPKLAA